jgi:hypothetical protein
VTAFLVAGALAGAFLAALRTAFFAGATGGLDVTGIAVALSLALGDAETVEGSVDMI